MTKVSNSNRLNVNGKYCEQILIYVKCWFMWNLLYPIVSGILSKRQYTIPQKSVNLSPKASGIFTKSQLNCPLHLVDFSLKASALVPKSEWISPQKSCNFSPTVKGLVSKMSVNLFQKVSQLVPQDQSLKSVDLSPKGNWLILKSLWTCPQKLVDFPKKSVELSLRVSGLVPKIQWNWPQRANILRKGWVKVPLENFKY